MQDILKLKVRTIAQTLLRPLADLALERRYPHCFRSEDDDASSTFKSQSEHTFTIGLRPDLTFT